MPASTATPLAVQSSGKSLHEIVAEEIRNLIVEGELTPGDFLDEMALAERFKVSRTPVREAIKVLVQDRFVTTFQNRGSYVTVVTQQYVKDILEVLAELESLGARLACERVHDRAIREVRQIHEEMKIAYRGGDRPQYFALNQDIHNAIVRASNNEQLIETYLSYTNRARRFRYMSNFTSKLWSRSMAEHDLIIKTLEVRDGNKLEALMRTHVGDIFPTIASEIGKETALRTAPPSP